MEITLQSGLYMHIMTNTFITMTAQSTSFQHHIHPG